MIFKLIIQNSSLDTHCEIALSQLNARESDVKIGSGKGLVLSGAKPLPEPMLTQLYGTMS